LIVLLKLYIVSLDDALQLNSKSFEFSQISFNGLKEKLIALFIDFSSVADSTVQLNLMLAAVMVFDYEI